jgi:hypothetical protein
MLARAQMQYDENIDYEIFHKIHGEIVDRYSVDSRLASEMAMDLLEVLAAVDGNIAIFEKYFLHQ